MPKVLIERNLKWDDREYPPGVAVEMPTEVVNSLPPGTVSSIPGPQSYPEHAPPSKPAEVKGAAKPEEKK